MDAASLETGVCSGHTAQRFYLIVTRLCRRRQSTAVEETEESPRKIASGPSIVNFAQPQNSNQPAGFEKPLAWVWALFCFFLGTLLHRALHSFCKLRSCKSNWAWQHTCLSCQVEAGGSGVQDYPRLHVMLEAILLCMKPYLNKPKQTNKKRSKEPLTLHGWQGGPDAKWLETWFLILFVKFADSRDEGLTSLARCPLIPPWTFRACFCWLWILHWVWSCTLFLCSLHSAVNPLSASSPLDPPQ